VTEEVLLYFCFSVPAAIVIITALLFYLGLRNPSKTNALSISIGVSLLVPIAVWIIGVSDASEGSNQNALLIALITTFAAIASAIALFARLKEHHKAAALGLGIFFPMILLIGVYTGSKSTPEFRAMANGRTLVAALNQYHADNGAYPQALDELTPRYMMHVNSSRWDGNWHYNVVDGEFRLGTIVLWLRAGNLIYFYSSEVGEWETIDYSHDFEERLGTSLFHAPEFNRPTPTANPLHLE
jgi:hypothetical protein